MGDARLDTAYAAVAKASAVAAAIQSKLDSLRAILKTDLSPVTVADYASQAIVAHYLSRSLGEIALVAEEDAAFVRGELASGDRTLLDTLLDAVHIGWPGAKEVEVLDALDRGGADPFAHRDGFWTLDPIDGTKGFIRGEQYSISLAFIENGRVIIGVLGCPKLGPGMIQSAISGGGVFESSLSEPTSSAKRIARGEPRPEEPVRLAESFEPSHSRQDSAEKLAESAGLRVETVRVDSQVKYALVARGAADLYVRAPHDPSYVERIWDHAAGSLVAEEAGCVVTDIHGAVLDFGQGRGLERNRGTLVAPPQLHSRVLAIVRELGA
jgi:3'(2'), 5'-bisphosphate nucleotidase